MAERAENPAIGVWTPAARRLRSILAILVAIGAVAFAWELVNGHVVLGLRDVGPMRGAPWGLYITFAIYLIGVSLAGVSTAVLIRLANIQTLKPVARMGELLTIVALIMAGIMVTADLGQPFRGFTNLLLYARPGSPFFGTFTLAISGYLMASVVYFYLGSRRDAALLATTATKHRGLYSAWAAGWADTSAEQARRRIASLWLSIAILPLALVANSTSGFVFGLQVGRPGWHSALLAPSFLVLAAISGIGVMIAIAAWYRRSVGDQLIGLQVFRWLAGLLTALLVVYGYFTVVELLTAIYAAGFEETEVWRATLTGPYAWIYVPSLVLFVVGLVLSALFLFKRVGVKGLVWAAVLVNVAAIGKRFIIVVVSLTDGALLPYGPGSYWPNFVEIALVVGVVSLGALLYYSFSKFFPLIELPEAAATENDGQEVAS